MQQVLPDLPKSDAETLAEQIEIFVNDIVVNGNTVFTEQEIARVTRSYKHRKVSSEELHDLRRELSLLYIQKGFINSGVIMPDQVVEDGVVHLLAVEGQLTEFNLTGNKKLRDSFIRKRVELGIDSPLNADDLQTALRTLQLNPLIRQVNAQLDPGVRPGESTLNVDVKENKRYGFTVGADNYRSPSIDEDRAWVSFVNSNLTGNGDLFNAQYSITEGVSDSSLYYSVPLTAKDLTVEGYYSQSDSNIVESDFDALDIESETDTWGFGLSRPFWVTPDSSLTGSIGFEREKSKSELDGIPFSFSPGEVDGKATASVLRAATEWVRSSSSQAFALRGTVRVGVDVAGATVNDQGPDSEFVSILGQAQYVRRMGWRDSNLILRSTTQLASDPLLAMEKFVVGGHATVRGYRENQFVRDNGFVASAEFRFPPFVDEDGYDRFNLKLAPFFDYGVSWDEDDDTNLVSSRTETIYSMGMGLLWDPVQDLHMQVYFGKKLKSVDNPSDGLQDKGFQFQLTYSPTARFWQ
jgi:hemolysin activation/secretion protein